MFIIKKFPKIGIKKICIYYIRSLAICFSMLWVWIIMKCNIIERTVSLNTITKAFILAIIINLGLFLITTRFGQKHKYLTLLCLLPSMLLNPLVMPIHIYFFLDTYIFIFINIISIIIIFKFNN